MGKSVDVEATRLDAITENLMAEATGRDATTAAQLRQHIDRIRALKSEIKELNSDVSDQYKAAESDGFDKQVLKLVVKRADEDRALLETQDGLLQFYETMYRAGTDEDYSPRLDS